MSPSSEPHAVAGYDLPLNSSLSRLSSDGGSKKPDCGDGAVLLGILALTAIGMLLQATTYLNHDVAWILYSSRKLLDGAVFGRDVIAANPPLAWYLTFPALFLSDATGIEPANAFRICVALVTLISCAWCHSLMRRAHGIPAATAPLLLFIFTYVSLATCYRDFGQRDYLMCILALPYVVLVAARLQGANISRLESSLIGVMAGIGVALKPHFLIIPVCVEFVGMCHQRRFRFFLRPEVIAAVATIVLYAAFVLVFVPDYVFYVVPRMRQIYWGFSPSWWYLMVAIAPEVIGLILVSLVVLRGKNITPVVMVLWAATLGCLLSYLSQRKGYSYHAFPLRCMSLLTLGLLVPELYRNRNNRSFYSWIALAAVVLMFIVTATVNTRKTWAWYRESNRLGIGTAFDAEERTSPGITDRLIAFLNQWPTSDTFLAISTHPMPGFPTALYSRPAWVSRTNSRICIPAIAKLREAEVPADDPRRQFAETWERELTLRDLQMRPSVVVVESGTRHHGMAKRHLDPLEFYLEDPTFQKEWRAYREVDQIGRNRIFVRVEQSP